MNLQERKAKLESIVAQHRQELERLAAYREKLVAELNAFYGQIQLLDEQIAEAESEVPPPPEPPPNEFEAGAVEEG